METTKQGIITLLRSSITGECLSLPEGFDLEEAYPQIRRHQIDLLVFEGALNCGFSRSHPVMRKLFENYCRILLVSEKQMQDLERVCRTFEENGIRHMPVKGANMKCRYPKPELRLMGDADILIHMEQYKKIVPLMESLGFEFKIESDTDLCWQSAGLYVELHRYLFTPTNKIMGPYFEKCWQKARSENGISFSMTPEDEWLYLLSHFAKHILYSGIGCRHVVDLWVFLRAHPDLNSEYIQRELKKLHLAGFHENVQRWLRAWFEDGEPDDVTQILEDIVFSGGSWGSKTNRIESDVIKATRRFHGRNRNLSFTLNYMFPNLRAMQNSHEILKKTPWLLPFMWLLRLIYKLLFDRNDWRRMKKELSMVTGEGVQIRYNTLACVGLGAYL